MCAWLGRSSDRDLGLGTHRGRGEVTFREGPGSFLFYMGGTLRTVQGTVLSQGSGGDASEVAFRAGNDSTTEPGLLNNYKAWGLWMPGSPEQAQRQGGVVAEVSMELL